MIKIVSTLGMEYNIYKIIQDILQEPTSNVIFSGETLKAFSIE